uniref:Progestin and adipoQ receptor family member 9 n=1 Tax=Sinocyclocheilus grahami TaxID=75366 RepID=A0A672T7I0_SINGR
VTLVFRDRSVPDGVPHDLLSKALMQERCSRSETQKRPSALKNKLTVLNLSFGPVMWSLPLLRYTDVPPRVTENFILSGYRFPNYSLRQCLVSAFRPTNETGNFWTHFLPIFVFTFHFLEVFTWEGAPEPSNPFFYPFWNYFLGVLYLLLGSSLAHLLNSMSLIIREISGIPEIGFEGKNSTRRKSLNCWRKYRYAVRTLVFLLPFFISSAPVFYRLLSPSASSPSSSSPHLFSTMATFFYRHCFWLVVSAFFNISKIPERFSPGNFDIWGHSHQWFHCLGFIVRTLEGGCFFAVGWSKSLLLCNQQANSATFGPQGLYC